MATFTDHIDDRTATVLEAQPLFFVATAAPGARVNVSPKGIDTLRVLGPHRLAYQDLTGSGNETAAHIAADGRITVMVCRFDRTADIIRVYGRGRIVVRGTAEWDDHIVHWDELLSGLRQLIVVDVDEVQSSCGYAVPLMDFVEHRQTLVKWAESRGEPALREYRASRNRTSIDGLPAPDPDPMASTPRTGKR